MVFKLRFNIWYKLFSDFLDSLISNGLFNFCDHIIYHFLVNRFKSTSETSISLFSVDRSRFVFVSLFYFTCERSSFVKVRYFFKFLSSFFSSNENTIFLSFVDPVDFCTTLRNKWDSSCCLTLFFIDSKCISFWNFFAEHKNIIIFRIFSCWGSWCLVVGIVESFPKLKCRSVGPYRGLKSYKLSRWSYNIVDFEFLRRFDFCLFWLKVGFWEVHLELIFTNSNFRLSQV